MISKISSQLVAKSALSAAVIGLLAAPIPVLAQASPAAGNTLSLPENITFQAQTNPNVRIPTAVVNGAVVTGTDVDHRLALTLAAAEGQVPEAEIQRLRMQILRNLIDETIKVQAAAADEMPVTGTEVGARYQELAASRFGQNPAAMDSYLVSIGSSPASLKRQIQGELAWARLLRRNVVPFVNVSAEEVNEIIARTEAARGTAEYRIGEIYLSSTPETETAVLENMGRIVEQLRQGGSFVAYARQFSESSSSIVGGDLGFLQLSTLPTEMAAATRQMDTGQLVGPVAIPGGFVIIYLIDKRQIAMADPRDAVLSLKQISISFPAGISEAQAQQRVEQFTLGLQTLRGCGDTERMAGEIGAEVVPNDQIQARQLPEQLQGAILALQLGQTTPPFGSIEDGVRVLQVCGRDDPAGDTGPNFEETMRRLEDERIDKRGQRYLRDLRNDAYIEYS